MDGIMSYTMWSAGEISQTSKKFLYESFQRRIGYTLQFWNFCVNLGFFSDSKTLSRIYTSWESALQDQSKNCAAFSVSHLKPSKTVNWLLGLSCFR